MALENFGFIKDLVDTNPAGSDPKSQGDDHLRGVKETLKNQFPGFTDGIGITLTEEELNKYKVPWVGEDYTDPDAVGANPTAQIYADGTIVGSTDNGHYRKSPDGTLEMWTTFTTVGLDIITPINTVFFSAAPPTFTHPIVATEIYTVVTDGQGGGGTIVWTSGTAAQNDSSKQYAISGAAITTDFVSKFNVVGRWK